MTDTDDRAHGIDFEGLDDELASHDYPATAGELVDAYGDHELSLPTGSTTLESVLEPAEDDQQFDSAEEVETTIYTLVDDDAVGATDYSDRGTGTDEEESESF